MGQAAGVAQGTQAGLAEEEFGEEPAEETIPEPAKGKGKSEAKPAPVKTHYHLFEEVQAFLDDGTDEGDPVLMWLPIGEYSASSGGSALAHHFERQAMPEVGRRFHAIPARSVRALLPPEPRPSPPSFREATD